VHIDITCALVVY